MTPHIDCSMSFEFEGPFPAPMKKEIVRLCHKWAWMLPQWVLLLQFKHDPAIDGTAMASSACSPEYGSARISFGDNWWASPEESRESDFLHELCHVALSPFANLADQTAGTFVPEGPAREFVGTALTDAEEVVVSHLTDRLMAKFGRKG